MGGSKSYSLKIHDINYDINKKSNIKTKPIKIRGSLFSFFSKDKKLFYNIGNNVLNIYDGISFSLTGTYKLMSLTAYFAISPDNNYLATETLNGTIGILDLKNGAFVYKKKISDIDHGDFFFIEDSASLIYASCGKIISIDYMHQGKTEEIFKMNQYIMFHNAFINRKTGEYIFECTHQCIAESEFSHLGEFAVKISCSDWNDVRLCSLTKDFVQATAKLTYNESKGLYYLPYGGKIHIYNDEFSEVNSFPLPSLVSTYQLDKKTETFDLSPNRCIASLSGEFVILDYFHGFLVVDNKIEVLLHYIFSLTGQITDIYFLDDTTIVYCCGCNTYIQKLDEISGY